MRVHATKAYNELIGSLLSDEERDKFEWAIGAVLSDGPSHIVVFRGAAATGKTTLMNIVRKALLSHVGEVLPRVTFIQDIDRPLDRVGMYREVDNGSFVFAETNRPLETLDGLVIDPTGVRIPVHKYYVLMSQIDSELSAIAETCIARYHSLGEDYYDNFQGEHR